MSLKNPPLAQATMLIRKPVAQVFDAFVNPKITTRFWFNRSSGPLTKGQKTTWYWDVYGVSAEVFVKELDVNRRLVIEWPSPVEWRFEAKSEDTTFVSITASGFSGTDDEKVSQALDSTGGFNLTIAACKAFLEHGIELNLVADKSPDAAVKNA